MTPVPEIRELPAQPAAVEVSVTDAAGSTAVIDRGFPRLFGRLAELGVAPAGPPYIRYLRMGEELELELGIPVPDGSAAADGALPAGRVAVLRHIGHFSGLREAGEGLERWVAEQGEEVAGPFWEAYVTDPSSEPDSSKWITDIHVPVR
jgi:effector-binding domain-containing protein